MAKRIEQAQNNAGRSRARRTAGTQWVKAASRRFTIRGLAWYEEDRPVLRRLPGRAEGIVPPGVWQGGQCLASARVCFRSDTTTLKVRAKVPGVIPYVHMPATGHSGMALYVGGPHEQKPWGVAFPRNLDATEYESEFFSGISREMREYTLYLPPYNGLSSLEIGLSPGAKLAKPSAPVLAKPAVFYGTSITQGGCVNNAGGDYASVLGRALNLDVVNLGFNGCGKGEPEVARLLAEIDACLFALDYVANVDPVRLKKTLPPFVKILREAHPTTPVLIMSRIVYMASGYCDTHRAAHEQQRDTIIHFYSRQRRAGDPNIHFVDGNALIPYAADLAHVDGGHPTGAGFQLMAERLVPYVQHALAL